MSSKFIENAFGKCIGKGKEFFFLSLPPFLDFWPTPPASPALSPFPRAGPAPRQPSSARQPPLPLPWPSKRAGPAWAKQLPPRLPSPPQPLTARPHVSAPSSSSSNRPAPVKPQSSNRHRAPTSDVGACLPAPGRYKWEPRPRTHPSVSPLISSRSPGTEEATATAAARAGIRRPPSASSSSPSQIRPRFLPL